MTFKIVFFMGVGSHFSRVPDSVNICNPLVRMVTVPTMQAIPQAVVSSWVTNTFVQQSKLAQDTLTNLRVGTTLCMPPCRVADAVGAAIFLIVFIAGMMIRQFYPRIRIRLSWKNIPDPDPTPDPTWNGNEEKNILIFKFFFYSILTELSGCKLSEYIGLC